MIRWIISAFFVVQMYVALAVIGILGFPFALIRREWAIKVCKAVCWWTMWTASWMIGLKTEVRGTPPKGEVLIAAKHMSFFDVIVIFYHLPSARFIMKREILWTPIVGQYGMRIGCVPVVRGRKGKALSKMVQDVGNSSDIPGQLIIYSQGTRVAPGQKVPYKVGTYFLHQETGQLVVPAATNIGVFWPKRGVMRKPGTAIVEFMEPMPEGLDQAEFMELLEARVEGKSNELMAEAGFVVKD